MLNLIMLAALAQQTAPTGVALTRDRMDQQAPTTPTGKRIPDGTATVTVSGSNQPIRGITFKGAQAPIEVAKAAEKFIGRPATKQTLVELAGALSRAYEHSNVALYTITIPEQSFKEGVVFVSLTEGWIKSAKVKTANGRPLTLVQAQADRMVGQKPLSRRRMERQFSLMRAIPGLKLDTKFENPNHDEAVDLVLDAKQRRSQFFVGIGNRGPDLVGDLVLQAGANFYGLATQGDKLSFSAASTRNPHRYRQLGGTYSAPLNADGLSLTANVATVRTGVRAFGTTIKGRARLAGVSLTYPIIREFERSADISVGIDGVNSNNAAFGNTISSERSRAVRLAGSYVAANKKRTISGSAILSQGLDAFGARITYPLADANFRKLSVNAGYEQAIGKRAFARLNASAQYSPDKLPGAELYSVGGASIGRAFDTGFLTGDSGAGGVLELAYRPLGGSTFDKTEVYAFTDAAKLTVHKRGPFPGQRYDMASAGLGTRLRYKEKIELGVEGAKVVNKPYPAYRDDWRLSFYYNLSL